MTGDEIQQTSELARLFAPVLSRTFGPLRKMFAVSEVMLRGNYEAYLERTTSAYQKICTILDPSVELELESVYVPLTIRSITSAESFEITDFPEKLFTKYPQNLVIDSAGMGKSTLSRFMLLQAARARKTQLLPIFVEMRRMNSDQSLLEFIANEISIFRAQAFSEDLLLHLIGTNQFLLMLDGVDEMPEAVRKAFVTGLKNILAKCPACPLWITSRNDPILTEFPSVSRWSVLPLTKPKAYQLIAQYEKNRQIAEQLIAALKQSSTDTVETFLGTPLLVVLLVGSYENKPLIPVKRSNFYLQVFDALFEKHDAVKGGYVRERKSKLSIDQFGQVMRALGLCLLEDGTVEFDKSSFMMRMQAVRQLVPHIRFENHDLLHDLLNAVPLLVHEAGKYRFAHKSMMDFFAGSCICQDLEGKADELLEKLYETKQLTRFSEVLRFCADIDFATFRKTVLKKLAYDIAKYGDSEHAICRGLPPKSAAELKKSAFFASFQLLRMPDSEVGVSARKRTRTAYSVFDSKSSSKAARSAAFDSMRADRRGQVTINTYFSNGYSLFRQLFAEHSIPFLVKVTKETKMRADAFRYLEPKLKPLKGYESIKYLSLREAEMPEIEANGDLSFLISRANLHVDFAEAKRFVAQLQREEDAGKTVIGSIISGMLQKA